MATNSTQVYSFPGMTTESKARCCDLIKIGLLSYDIFLTNRGCMKSLRSLTMRPYYVLKYNFFANTKHVILKAWFYIWSRILRFLEKESTLGRNADLMVFLRKQGPNYFAARYRLLTGVWLVCTLRVATNLFYKEIMINIDYVLFQEADTRIWPQEASQYLTRPKAQAWYSDVTRDQIPHTWEQQG